MSTLRPPSPPGSNASDIEFARYQQELRSYKIEVQNIASEIEILCRDIFNTCEALGNSPLDVMESVSTNIWQGRAAMEFQGEGGTHKKAVNDGADEIRNMTLNVMKSTNEKLSTL